ncbi:Z1 domain-containing protein [Paenibacillus ehimensis]|uniref:Z1 domain-containing protein n=1 Tax=Paenibacillus ehimensis TaxID=79264 RepID=UPI002DBAE172|nr:Z1 domain-containing protein [Paenibacillus ehimensis]MEC0207664.1 Z1 domain-containing protein [Paenibacillus ehimensis]
MSVIDIVESVLNQAFVNKKITDLESFNLQLKRALEVVSGLGYELTEEEVVDKLNAQLQEFLRLYSGTAIIETKEEFNGKINLDGPRWRAYLSFLRKEKNRSNAQINGVTLTLQTILKHMLKNQSQEEFYVNGMVFKDVQSGKTEHFHGLTNLAIDNGYEIIIILSGTQNDLRSQTQIRCDYDVLGEKRLHYVLEDGEDRVVGIGKYRNSPVLTQCLTNKMRNGDLNASVGEGVYVARPGEPIIIVTKKNVHTLGAVISFLRNSKAERNKVLIIDDEADLASVDTSYNSKINRGKQPSDDTYKPSSINAHIREMIAYLKKRTYISYTATPFANLLINREINHPVFGPDLFPKDFIIAIPSDENYVGPKQWFGKNAPAAPLRRPLENTITRDLIRDASAGTLHSTLIQSIKVFILSTAVRLIREGEQEHCSMLIHADYRNINHDTTYPLVDREIELLRNLIIINDEATMNELKRIFEDDIVTTSTRIFNKVLPLTWKDVNKVLSNVVERIKVMKINGESEDTLNYEDYKNQGLYVVAVGGNKLSRGITLDGLTVSYYVRESKNHDTLTQMGRWCGYKKAYLDVCRLYTTNRLIVAYAQIVESLEKLREDLILMHDSDLTPDQYQLEIIEQTTSICPALRVISNAQQNLKLQVTANNKSRFMKRHKRRSSFSGETLQETSFYNESKIITENKKVVEVFLKKLRGKPDLIGKYIDQSGYNRIWYGIDMIQVLEMFKNFRSPRGRVHEWVNYIEAVHRETKMRELALCDVVLISNNFDGSSEKLYSYEINRVHRSTRGVDTMLQAVTLKGEQFINFRSADEALSDNQKISMRNNDRALLLIYPIRTENLDGTDEYEIITFAIAFPITNSVPEDTISLIGSTTVISS